MQAFLHFGIAALLLLAQSGVSVHHHYCQEQLMGARLLLPAPSCHESSAATSKEKTCPLHGSNSPGGRDCCKDRSVFVKADLDGWPLSLTDLQVEPPQASMMHLAASGIFPWTKLACRPINVQINGPPPDYRLELPWLQRFNS